MSRANFRIRCPGRELNDQAGEIVMLRRMGGKSVDSARWFFEAPEHFRIGFGCPTETLRGGLDRLAAALDELGDPRRLREGCCNA